MTAYREVPLAIDTCTGRADLVTPPDIRTCRTVREGSLSAPVPEARTRSCRNQATKGNG